jgi:hypothetical protein
LNKIVASCVDSIVKTKTITIRIYRSALAALLVAGLGSSMSCMTTYDAYGRPVQSVDPGLAIAGIAAAGLIGYSMSHDNDYGGHHHYRTYRPYGGYHCR